MNDEMDDTITTMMSDVQRETIALVARGLESRARAFEGLDEKAQTVLNAALVVVTLFAASSLLSASAESLVLAGAAVVFFVITAALTLAARRPRKAALGMVALEYQPIMEYALADANLFVAYIAKSAETVANSYADAQRIKSRYITWATVVLIAGVIACALLAGAIAVL